MNKAGTNNKEFLIGGGVCVWRGEGGAKTIVQPIEQSKKVHFHAK